MKTKSKQKNVRLERHIVPTHYEITLKPDLEAHTFSGSEVITVTLTKAANEITLHSKDLHITSAVIGSGKKKLEAKKISYNDERETATFLFPHRIKKGKVKLSILWEGVLSDTMRGFYKSRYHMDGKERFMATTQFEATDARRAIPSFDEPTHKAVFRVHLIVPLDKTAISNTLPVSIREHEAGYKIVSFAPTPKMSTYLLAFIVGDFEWIEKKTKSGVLVRVMTVPGKKHQGKFALDVAVKSLEFYEKYFGIAYPLNTLDMIAVPDFASGAMENWGAVTYRESALLVDPEHTSLQSRQWVALVIAHELAHQWFGNLVTMEWWTHLWLNEGFASYIEYLAVDHLFPSWNMWEQFVTSDFAIALKLDALKNTHPIEVNVHHPNEIGEIFDAVSYSKGASVIRMLAEYLGEKDFRDGLRYYLKKHSYKNASTVHLWEAFEKISKKPVKKMMALWTGEPGYPYLEVAEKGTSLLIEQKRFFSNPKNIQKKDTTRWYVPFSLITDRGINSYPILTKEKTKILKPESFWLKVNPNESGLYRVSYSMKLLERLELPIKEGRLGAIDRLGIVRDLFSLLEAGTTPSKQVLTMISLYRDETDYNVWIEILTGLRHLANLLSGSPSEEKFRAFGREMVRSAVELVSWEPRTNESHTDSLLRPLILGAAASFEEESVVRESQKRFNKREQVKIHADLRSVVYQTVARAGGDTVYRTLRAMYLKEPLHEEKNRILIALGQFKDEKLVQSTLEFIMSEQVRMQDRNTGFTGILMNPHNRDQAWEFIKKNWEKIGEAYGEGNHLLSRLIGALNRYSSWDAYLDIKKFFKTHSAPAAERTILQTLEQIDSNISFLKREYKNIESFLNTKSSQSFD